jgi:hypothetical protein
VRGREPHGDGHEPEADGGAEEGGDGALSTPAAARASGNPLARYRWDGLRWYGSRRQYPDAWEFPLLAAYDLLKTRHYEEAVRHLHRVEELHPGVPGVSPTLERLTALHAAASSVP